MDYAGIAYAHQFPRTRREVLHTLIQEDLFPTIVEGLLRVLVPVALEDGCKRSDVLQTSPKPFRDESLLEPIRNFGVTPTSASRKRISDLRLPFLIEPGRKLSISPTSTVKGKRWIILLTVRGIGPPVELTHSIFVSDNRHRHGRPVNVPPDTARHALYATKISPPVRLADENFTAHQFGSLRPASEVVLR